MSKNRPRYRRLLGCLIVCGALLLMLPLIAYAGFLLYATQADKAAGEAAEQKLSQIQADGFPIDTPTLERYYQEQTDDQDAGAWLEQIERIYTTEYEEAARGVPLVGDSELSIPTANTPEALSQLAEEERWEEGRTRQFLDQWEDMTLELERMGRAQLDPERRPVQFPVFFDSIETRLPHVMGMRGLARLMILRGRVALYDRDSEGVKDSIVATLGMAETLRGEPILISQLSRVGMLIQAHGLLQDALQEDALSPEALRELVPLVSRQSKFVEESWQMAMAGERAMMLPVFGSPELVQPNADQAKLNQRLFRWVDTNAYLDFMDQVVSAPTESNEELLEAASRADAEFEELVLGGNMLTYVKYMVTGLVAPAVVASSNAFVETESRANLATLAMLSRIYYAEHGQFPDALNDLESLSEEMQIDLVNLKPTGPNPFGYTRPSEQEAIVWGFSFQTANKVPASLPKPSPEQPHYEDQLLWIWRINAEQNPEPE